MITIPQGVTPSREVLEHRRKRRSGTKYSAALTALDQAAPGAWIPVDGIEDAGRFRAAISQYSRAYGKRVSVVNDVADSGRIWLNYIGPREQD